MRKIQKNKKKIVFYKFLTLQHTLFHVNKLKLYYIIKKTAMFSLVTIDLFVYKYRLTFLACVLQLLLVTVVAVRRHWYSIY